MDRSRDVPLVLYDYQIFVKQRYGGISRYVHELATRVAARRAFRAGIYAPFHINSYLSGDPSGLVRGRRIPVIPRTGKLRARLNRFVWGRWARGAEPGIVHETYYSLTGSAPGGARTVVTVHDMIHERFPDAFRAEDDTPRRKAAAVVRADHIVCVSDSTRRDLLERLDVDPDKVSVVPLGCSFRPPERMPPRVVREPYLLYVGHRAGHKNFVGLLQALGSSPDLRRDLKLVVFGGGRLRAGEWEQVRRAGLDSERVVHTGGSDERLASLYAHASLFVYPSLYEGFGIPPLEAMAMNCPVACSGTSSLPEVVGDAAETFDPSDSTDILRAIERVVGSDERRSELIRRGRSRVATFTWDRCASMTERVYARLAG